VLFRSDYEGTMSQNFFVPGAVPKLLEMQKLAGATNVSFSRATLLGLVNSIGIDGNVTIGATGLAWGGATATNVSTMFDGSQTGTGTVSITSTNTLRYFPPHAQTIRDYFTLSVTANGITSTFPVKVQAVPPSPGSPSTPQYFTPSATDPTLSIATFLVRPNQTSLRQFSYNGQFYPIRDLSAPMTPEGQAEVVNGVTRPPLSINSGPSGVLTAVVPTDAQSGLQIRNYTLPPAWWSDDFLTE